MKKKQKLIKGQRGYINFKKRTQLLKALMYVGIGILIFIFGLLVNKFEKSNIFTIIAILMVLPMAKRLVNFIVFLPFQSVPEETYQAVSLLKKEEDTLYTDAVFTSSEKIMYLSFLIIAGNEVIGLIGREKEDKEYITKYLTESIRKRGWSYKVTIYTKKESFFKRYKTVDRSLIREEESELKDFLWSLLVE